MLICLIQTEPEIYCPLTIDVPEESADAVISATAGGDVVSKLYGPPLLVLDSLQVALLEVSTLPPSAPVRVAVELGASAAIRHASVWALGRAAHPPRSRTTTERRQNRSVEPLWSQTGGRSGQDVIH